jgi:hypothetical protein
VPLASSLSSLRRVPASCQRAHIFVFLEGLGLRLSASATGGETQVFSPTRKRAGEVCVSRRLRSQPGRLSTTPPRRGASVLRRLTGVPPQWWAEVFCGVVNYGEEEAAVSADAASPAADCPPPAASAPAGRGGCAVRRCRSPQILRP